MFQLTLTGAMTVPMATENAANLLKVLLKPLSLCCFVRSIFLHLAVWEISEVDYVIEDIKIDVPEDFIL